jgi:hypothetical protein
VNISSVVNQYDVLSICKSFCLLFKIDKGEAFAKGNTLEPDIGIRQELDESVNAYINKGYIIIRVIRHVPRSGQSKLYFSKA